MIKKWSSDLGVIDHSAQGAIHAKRYGVTVPQSLRNEPLDLPLSETFVERKDGDLSWYAPANLQDFLASLGPEPVQVALKECETDFPKFCANLEKFGHITQAYAAKAVRRRSEWCFLSGAAIPRSEAQAYLDSLSQEKAAQSLETELSKAPPAAPTNSFIGPDGQALALDVAKIREITGFSFSPWIEHRNAHVFIPWKKRFLESTAKLLMPITCRQAGKTHDAAELCVEESFKPNTTILIVSISVTSTKNLQKYFKRFIRGFGPDVFTESKADRTFINNLTGSEIVFAPAGTMEHAENLRGKTVDLLIVDEAWLLPDGVWDEILKPTLIVRQGRCVMLTTMRKERNWYFHLLAEVKKGEHADAETFTVPYWDNPFYPEAEMEAIKKREHLPHVKREYLCKYDAGDASAFDLSESLLPDLSQCAFVVGYDPARLHDRSGLCGLAITREGKAIAAVAREIPQEFKGKWELQREYVRQFRSSLPCTSKLVGDITGVGDGVAEIFAMGGQAFDLKVRYVGGNSMSIDDNDHKMRKAGKSYLVNMFRDNCESGDFSAFAPTCFDLFEEIQFASVKKLASGAETFESSFFDDVINASMLACFGWRELRVRAPELDAKAQGGMMGLSKKKSGSPGSNVF
jgi:hypothetical protein